MSVQLKQQKYKNLVHAGVESFQSRSIPYVRRLFSAQLRDKSELVMFLQQQTVYSVLRINNICMKYFISDLLMTFSCSSSFCCCWGDFFKKPKSGAFVSATIS